MHSRSLVPDARLERLFPYATTATRVRQIGKFASRRSVLPAFLLGVALLIQSCAIEIHRGSAGPSAEEPDWMTSAQYQAKFDRMFKEGFYPYEVHGKCESGYEQFSAKWTGIPMGWRYYARSGTSKERFDQYNEEYISKGFALEFSSTFEDCAGKTRYQGVWLNKP